MNTTGEMLSVLVDGLKDIDNMMKYTDDSKRAGDQVAEEWFKRHIAARYKIALEDYDWIRYNIKFKEKIESGDAVTETLDEYIRFKLAEFSDKMDESGISL